MTKIGLYARFPIAKKVWRMCSVEKDIDPDTILATAIENINDYYDKMIEWRLQHPRAFKRPPTFLKFFLIRSGNPRIVRSSKVGEFDIFLDGRPPRIVVPWF